MNKIVKKGKNKLLTGFTIIELLVVVAIIAVLAAIVLVNVTGYITKGKDAAAKGNLATLMVNAAVFYDTNSNYTNFEASSGYNSVNSALTAAGYTLTSSCNGSADCVLGVNTSFCGSVVMKATPTNSYCVDTTGWKREGVTASNTCTAGVCPTT